jgi:hypothetical protein
MWFDLMVCDGILPWIRYESRLGANAQGVTAAEEMQDESRDTRLFDIREGCHARPTPEAGTMAQ